MDTIRCIALFAILLAATLVRGEEQPPVPTRVGVDPAEGLVPMTEENEPAYFPIQMKLRIVQFTGDGEFEFDGEHKLDGSGSSLTTLSGDGRDLLKAMDKFAAQDFVTSDSTAIYSAKLSGMTPWASRNVRRVPTGREQVDVEAVTRTFLSPSGKIQLGIELLTRNTLHEGSAPPKTRTHALPLFMDLGQTLVYESAPFKLLAKDGHTTSYRWIVVAVAKLAER